MTWDRGYGISDLTLAVIAAAVAAYESEQSGSGDGNSSITVRKIDRRAGIRPAWALAGLAETIDARKDF